MYWVPSDLLHFIWGLNDRLDRSWGRKREACIGGTREMMMMMKTRVDLDSYGIEPGDP